MNKKGFVLAWFALLLIFIIGILSSTSSLLIIQWNKQKSTEFCRQELKNIQQSVADQARVLLSLNPQSIQLRTELLLVESKIVAALASGQIYLVKILKIERSAIRLRQKNLDLKQKLIIKNAHADMKIKIYSLRQSLNHQLDKNGKNLGHWGHSHHYLAPPPQSRFSFKPTDRLLAPTYEPYKNFEKNQSLAISWVEKYDWNKWQKAFSFPTQVQSQCRISLREGSWKTIIQKDRL